MTATSAGTILVVDSNNRIGLGPDYTFVIPNGTYTREELQALIVAEQRRVAAARYPVGIVLRFPS